jgi:fructoselysine 6-kinase
MKKILGIGDNTVDLYVNKELMFPGGNAVNVAVHARRCGVESAYLGCLGKDKAGSLIYNSLVAEQVEVSHCRRLEGHNSWSRVIHQGNDRVFGEHNPGVRYQYNLRHLDFDYIRTFDLAHSSIFSGLESELGKLDRATPLISFDFSDSSDWSYLNAVSPYIDIAFLSSNMDSEQDIRNLAQRVHTLGPLIVVIMQGEQGALAYDGTSYHSQSIVPTDVVDTLGAGDGFIAGFLVDYLENQDIQSALSSGTVAASKVCSMWGAFGYGVPFR